MAFSASPVGSATTQSWKPIPCGNYRAISIPVRHPAAPEGDGSPVDLTGWSAEWTLGIPDNASALLLGPYAPPQTCVLKASGANLDIVTINGASSLRFALTYADTISLPPRGYWQEAVVIDPQGNPYTVAEGRVNLTPSLRAVRASNASPLPLSPVVPVSFAIWQGDDTPPQVWSFGTPSNPTPLNGSVFVLTVMGLDAPGGTFVARSDAGDGVLVVDTNVQTVTWNYSKIVSAAIPPTGATYKLDRLIAGTTQLWTHGSIQGLVK